MVQRLAVALAAIVIAFPAFARSLSAEMYDASSTFAVCCPAFEGRNDSSDGIVGSYISTYGGESYKVRVTRKEDGTYRAQVFWLSNPTDANGNKFLDVKNPDKSLRGVTTDRIVLIDGLKYDSANREWSGAKIYDPSHGLKANVVCKFAKDGNLTVRGSILGIGQTIIWTPVGL